MARHQFIAEFCARWSARTTLGAGIPMLNGALAERTGRWLPAHSSLTERVYPGLAHGINDEGISDVRAFLDGWALSSAPGH